MAIELVFETHSMSVDNEQGHATGWLPGQLSEQGQTQAQQLGRRRLDDGIDFRRVRGQQGRFKQVERLEFGLASVRGQGVFPLTRFDPPGRDRDQFLVQSCRSGTIEAESTHQDNAGYRIVRVAETRA